MFEILFFTSHLGCLCLFIFAQAGLIWKPHGKAKIKKRLRLYVTHKGKDSLLCPEIADLSNEDHNTCSKNTFGQPHTSQERILLRDLLQTVGQVHQISVLQSSG